MECDCEDWKKYIERVKAPEIFIQTTRPYVMKPYPKEGVFKYCPWCGKKLIEYKGVLKKKEK